MKQENCIFCKIANGDIPSCTITENDHFRVILDISPANLGHALILPKEHFAHLYDLPEELAKEAIVLAKKLAVSMKNILHCDGVNLVQNNEEAAGQTVFHFHLHVIPRFNDDELKISWQPKEVSMEELNKIGEQLKGAFY